jgi:hypothetical protein
MIDAAKHTARPEDIQIDSNMSIGSADTPFFAENLSGNHNLTQASAENSSHPAGCYQLVRSATDQTVTEGISRAAEFDRAWPERYNGTCQTAILSQIHR